MLKNGSYQILQNMRWNELSMSEIADIIKQGVKAGVTDLQSIKETFEYYQWKKALQEHRGWQHDLDEDGTYNYRQYYHDNPEDAWSMLEKDSDTHFTDTYKTVTHPTFSNESMYSGYKNEYNPQGLTGGTWKDDYNYQLSQSQWDNDWDTDATIDYLNSAEEHPVNFTSPEGANILRSLTVYPKKYGRGGHIYDGTTEDTQLMSTSVTPVNYETPWAITNRGNTSLSPEEMLYFNSKQDRDTYAQERNYEPVFQEPMLNEVVTVAPITNKNRSKVEYNKYVDQYKENNPQDWFINRHLPYHIWYNSYYQPLENYYNSEEYLERNNAVERPTLNSVLRGIDIYEGDQRIKAITDNLLLEGLVAPTKFFSPSQQVGALFDWAQGEKGYWEGIGGNNSGFFTDEFEQKHPIITAVTNGIVDGMLLDFIPKSYFKPGLYDKTTRGFRREAKVYDVGQHITDNAPDRVKEALSVYKHLEDDVADKIIDNLSDEGWILTPQEKIIIRSNIEDLVNIRAANLGFNPETKRGTMAVSYFDNGNIGVDINVLNNPELFDNYIERLATIINHEAHHSRRNLLTKVYDNSVPGSKGDIIKLERGNSYKNLQQQQEYNGYSDVFSRSMHALGKLPNDAFQYTPKEQELLDKAFKFSPENLTNLSPTIEKGASAREIAATLRYRNNFVSGEDFNNIVDNLTFQDILEILNNQNGYTVDFAKHIKESDLPYIKEAIKTIR